jgi:hypothetical protein
MMMMILRKTFPNLVLRLSYKYNLKITRGLAHNRLEVIIYNRNLFARFFLMRKKGIYFEKTVGYR